MMMIGAINVILWIFLHVPITMTFDISGLKADASKPLKLLLIHQSAYKIMHNKRYIYNRNHLFLEMMIIELI